jgi:hypothetical protein
MNDHVFEDMLSRRLKRATVEIAETSPLHLGRVVYPEDGRA